MELENESVVYKPLRGGEQEADRSRTTRRISKIKGCMMDYLKTDEEQGEALSAGLRKMVSV